MAKTKAKQEANDEQRAPVLLPNELTVEDYANKIAGAWNKQVENIINTGRLLIEAKEALDEHGKWLVLFEDKRLPFGERTGQRLMSIARHPILSNPTHGSLLPPSWRTLYELTSIPDRILERMLSNGQVHPEMNRNEVERITESRRHEAGFFSAIIMSLEKLTAAMKKYPDASAIAFEVWGESDGEPPIKLDEVAKLPAWITVLHAARQPAEEVPVAADA